MECGWHAIRDSRTPNGLPRATNLIVYPVTGGLVWIDSTFWPTA